MIVIIWERDEAIDRFVRVSNNVKKEWLVEWRIISKWHIYVQYCSSIDVVSCTMIQGSHLMINDSMLYHALYWSKLSFDLYHMKYKLVINDDTSNSIILWITYCDDRQNWTGSSCIINNNTYVLCFGLYTLYIYW